MIVIELDVLKLAQAELVRDHDEGFDPQTSGVIERLIAEVRRLRAATIRSQVSAFHKAFNILIADTPSIPSDDIVRLRMRLIGEEFCEVLDATVGVNSLDAVQNIRERLHDLIDNGEIDVDLPELADGLGDLDYVVEGTRLSFGIDGQPVADEIQRSNMAKVGGPKRESDGKQLKPPGWTSPDIESALRRQGWGG